MTEYALRNAMPKCEVHEKPQFTAIFSIGSAVEASSFAARARRTRIISS